MTQRHPDGYPLLYLVGHYHERSGWGLEDEVFGMEGLGYRVARTIEAQETEVRLVADWGMFPIRCLPTEYGCALAEGFAEGLRSANGGAYDATVLPDDRLLIGRTAEIIGSVRDPLSAVISRPENLTAALDELGVDFRMPQQGTTLWYEQGYRDIDPRNRDE